MSRTSAHSPSPARIDRFMLPLLFAAVLIAYWPSLSGGFLWDDDGHLTRPHLQSLDGLARIWFEPASTQQYYPLLHSAFWLEYKLWGDSPLGYRLVNLLLHATAAFLFAALLRRLAVPGAWLAAFLFALHPVCVESIAWITEQKNTLSLVFYLAAALAYLRFDDTRRPAAYAIATALFAAALLSKTVTATLPTALLVVFAWKRRRLDPRRDILPLLPWFVLSLSAGLMTVWTERTQIGAEGGSFALSFAERTLLAGRALWFYLGKLLWPADLVFIYPRWTIDTGRLAQWLFLLAALAFTTALALRKNFRPFLAPWLLFVGTLFPALGFFNVYPFLFSYVADHFQYHASLAVFATAAALITHLAPRLPRSAFLAIIIALPALLGVLSSRQSIEYRNARTLYESTLDKNPACWLAHNNLAQLLTTEGRPDLAIEHLTAALSLRPDFPNAENNLGLALHALGRPREAIPHFERAITLQPLFPEASNNLGLALGAIGESDRAIAAFREAIRAHPRYPAAHVNLGVALARTGRHVDAIPEFARAATLDPAYADAEFNWAVALMLTEKFPEAIPHFDRALSLAPGSVENLHTYARALATNARLPDAIRRYREALALAPDEPSLHLELAQALRQSGQLEAAAFHHQESQRLNR